MSEWTRINSVEDLKLARRDHSETDVWDILYDYSRTKLIDLLMEASE